MSTSIWLHFAVVLRQNSVSCLVFAWGDRGCFGQSCPQVHSQTLDIIVVTRLSCPYLLHLHPVETLVHSTISGLKNLDHPEISTRNPKIPHRFLQLWSSWKIHLKFPAVSSRFLSEGFIPFLTKMAIPQCHFDQQMLLCCTIYINVYILYIYIYVSICLFMLIFGKLCEELSTPPCPACLEEHAKVSQSDICAQYTGLFEP